MNFIKLLNLFCKIAQDSEKHNDNDYPADYMPRKEYGRKILSEIFSL